MKKAIALLHVVLFLGFSADGKSKRLDSVECDVKKQSYGSVLECGDDIYSVKMGSPVEKSLYQICKSNFKCKISFEANARDEVTKIMSAFSKGKKLAKTYLPSFECKKQRTDIEEMICTDEELAKLDNRLGAEIKIILEKSEDTKAVRDEQKNWLKNNRDKCKDKECLMSEYKMRLEKFKSEE